ncbi:helix-turn-helix transcriptional regulator [Kitasatospora purpeofusca]|uniref:helix-turn-helix transcriptional regulator n=1 Tax=Kitasatospora purpeofusca TaxID=67352 RepID=UPI00381355AD
MADLDDARLLLTAASKDLYLRMLAGEQPQDGAALRLLIQSHLVEHNPATGGWEPCDVDVVVHQMQTTFQTMAGQLLAEAQSVPAQLRELSDAYRTARPRRRVPVEYVTGTAAINERLGRAVRDATGELLSAQASGPRPAHVLAASYQQDLAALGRGLTLQTIYLPSARADEPTARWARTMTEHGAQIRTSNRFSRMIIIDRRLAVTSVLTRGKPDPVAVDQAAFVTDETMVQLLVAAWERDWERAEPWDGTGGHITLTPLQRDILDGIARGLEQEEIAGELHVSRRTVANRLAEVREATGARSIAQVMYWYGTHRDQL